MTDHQQNRSALVKAIASRLFYHNWPYKLLATLLAIVLWAALITQDPTLTREKVFTDVPVTISGADTMKRNGYIVVSDMDELLRSVTVEADVPQRRYDDAAASSYNIRVDLTRITGEGVHEVKIASTASNTYGSVTQITPATIPVQVEAYVTRYRIPVSQNIVGEAPEGWYTDQPTVSPGTVTVSGPKSLVESIARASVTIDLSLLVPQEMGIRSAEPFILMDRAGNVIESKLVSVTSEGVLLDSVIVEQRVYPTLPIHLSSANLVTGTPAAGYEIKNVTFTPDTVTAAASLDNLEMLDSLFASTSVDVTGAKESITRVLTIRKPIELVSLTPSTVTVHVEIGPIPRSRSFNGLKINVDNLDSTLRSSVAPVSANVTVTGPMLWVNSLKNNAIRLYCDVSGLSAGTYELPVMCTVTADENAEYTTEVSLGTVSVTLKNR